MRGLLWMLFLVEVTVRISHSICILIFPVIYHSKFFLLDYGWFMLHSKIFLLDYGCLISISVVIWLSWCIFCVNYILLHFWMSSLCLHVVWYLNLRGNASYIMCLTRVVISCFSRFFFFFLVCHCVIRCCLQLIFYVANIICSFASILGTSSIMCILVGSQ